jgi:hypothetical protein
MLKITDQVAIPESELTMTAIRASGPGGQNVNKVATAIHLRFDIANSTALDASGKEPGRGIAAPCRPDSPGIDCAPGSQEDETEPAGA